MKRFSSKIALSGALFLVVAFSGCAGGTSSSPNSSTTNVYFTDAPIAGYSQVLVTVLSAQLRNTATGATAVIADFTSSGGASFDLTDLSGLLRLVNIMDIPVGTYDRVEVLLANSAILLDQSGNTVVAKFAPDGDTYSLGVNVNLTISTSPTSTLVFDFDLTQFSYDQLTGILRAVIIPVDSAETYASYGRLDELEGTILTVDQAHSRLTVHLEHSPSRSRSSLTRPQNARVLVSLSRVKTVSPFSHREPTSVSKVS